MRKPGRSKWTSQLRHSLRVKHRNNCQKINQLRLDARFRTHVVSTRGTCWLLCFLFQSRSLSYVMRGSPSKFKPPVARFAVALARGIVVAPLARRLVDYDCDDNFDHLKSMHSRHRPMQQVKWAAACSKRLFPRNPLPKCRRTAILTQLYFC